MISCIEISLFLYRKFPQSHGRGSSLARYATHRWIATPNTQDLLSSRQRGAGGRGSGPLYSALSRTPSGQGGGRVVRIEGIEGRVSDAWRSDIRSRDLVKSRAVVHAVTRLMSSGRPPARRRSDTGRGVGAPLSRSRQVVRDYRGGKCNFNLWTLGILNLLALGALGPGLDFGIWELAKV